mgnify:CR=1 FL=1
MHSPSHDLAGSAGRGATGPNRRRVWRQLWIDVHSYLGLFVGALLVVFGVTGSILVFFQEIDEWMNPALLTVSVPDPGQESVRPLHEILAAAEQAATPGSRMAQLYGPRNAASVYAIYTEQPSKAWQRIYVDPYRARVTGVRSYAAHEWVPNYVMDVIFQLHFALFLGENGITIVAVCALFLLLSLITGVMVWWPLTGQWRQAFAIRRPTNPVRLNFDLHKTFSLYTCAVLGAVLLSGVWMNWNEPFVWVTQLFSPATRGPAQMPTSTPVAGQASISAEQALAIATARYPEGALNLLVLPEEATGVYLVSRKDVPGLSVFWSERTVSIDRYSGEILEVRGPDTRRSAGETFADWQWPLHSGQAFGWAGRLMVFASGLACPVIYVTGFRIWWRKRRTKTISKLGAPNR